MRSPRSRRLQQIFRHPGRFAWQVLRGFRANQGFLLAGAVAYYTLLSIIPLVSLILITLSHFVDTTQLLATFARYLEYIVPGESQAMLGEVENLLAHREVVSWVLVSVLLFFSSMAFTVLENAMSVIFFHRVAVRRRHFLFSAILPYVFIVLLGLGFLFVTLIAGVLQTVGRAHVDVVGWQLSLEGLAVVLLYLIGLVGQILILTSIYLVMPVGRLSVVQALLGGVTAGLLWEITRHILVWYFSSLSMVNVVYGSLATVVIVLLTLEIGAIIFLLGAQVIAEFERFGQAPEAATFGDVDETQKARHLTP